MEIKNQKQAKRVLLQLQGELHKLELQYQKANGFNKGPLEAKITQTAVLWLSVLGEATQKGFVENNGVTVTISGTELKNPEQIGPVTLSVFKRAEEMSKTEIKSETLAKGNTMKTLKSAIKSTPATIEAAKASFEGKKFAEAVEDVKTDILNFEGDKVTPELYEAVVTYITALAHYKRKSDATGASTLTAENDMVNEAVNMFYEALKEADEEVSGEFGTFLSALVDATDEEDKEGWTHKIWVGCKRGGSFVIDLAKGIVMYVYGGVCKVLGAVCDIAGYTIGKLVGILDAATTKDFGRKGETGVLVKAMKEASSAA